MGELAQGNYNVCWSYHILDGIMMLQMNLERCGAESRQEEDYPFNPLIAMPWMK